MANISKAIIDNSKRVIADPKDYKKALGYICEITLLDGSTMKGEVIRKIASHFQDLNETIYYLPVINKNGKVLIEETTNEFYFINFDETFYLDLNKNSFTEKIELGQINSINLNGYNGNLTAIATLRNPNAIKKITIINDLNSCVKSYDKLDNLLTGNTKQIIKLKKIDKEIRGCLIKLEVGEEFVDCINEIHGASYPYVFIFDNAQFIDFTMPYVITTFMPIDPDCFNRDTNDSMAVEYIRRIFNDID